MAVDFSGRPRLQNPSFTLPDYPTLQTKLSDGKVISRTPSPNGPRRFRYEYWMTDAEFTTFLALYVARGIHTSLIIYSNADPASPNTEVTVRFAVPPSVAPGLGNWVVTVDWVEHF